MADEGELIEIVRSAKWNTKPRIVDYLKRGGDINITDESGKTALHHAVSEDDDEIVKFLIEKGADVNALDNDGYAPIGYTYGDGYMIKILLKRGARPDSMCLLKKRGYPILCAMIKDISSNPIQYFDKVIELGCDPNSYVDCDHDLRITPLFLCVKKLGFLRGKLVDRNFNDPTTKRLYHEEFVFLDLIKLFLKYGADPDMNLSCKDEDEYNSARLLSINLGLNDVVELFNRYISGSSTKVANSRK